MKSIGFGMLAVIGLAMSGGELRAQTVSTTPQTSPVQPAKATRQVLNSGTYTLGANQQVDRVVVDWYKIVGQNLEFAGRTDDQAPANGTYKTAEIPVPVKDANGNVLQYAGFAFLYVKNNRNFVATAGFYGYTPQP